MSNDTPTEPVRPTGAEPAPVEPAPVEPAPPAAGKQSFRDRYRRVGSDGSGRTFGLAALLASTLAALIVGGLGGVALHAAIDDDRPGPGDRGGWMGERHGPGGPGERRR